MNTPTFTYTKILTEVWTTIAKEVKAKTDSLSIVGERLQAVLTAYELFKTEGENASPAVKKGDYNYRAFVALKYNLPAIAADEKDKEGKVIKQGYAAKIAYTSFTYLIRRARQELKTPGKPSTRVALSGREGAPAKAMKLLQLHFSDQLALTIARHVHELKDPTITEIQNVVAKDMTLTPEQCHLTLREAGWSEKNVTDMGFSVPKTLQASTPNQDAHKQETPAEGIPVDSELKDKWAGKNWNMKRFNPVNYVRVYGKSAPNSAFALAIIARSDTAQEAIS